MTMRAMTSGAKPRLYAAAGVSLAIVTALVVHFHDQFWWPVDEGVYAYVAQRILAGDRLHIDLIELHGGYGNLLNALALHYFGQDLLSLRYPLAVVTIVQSALLFWLTSSRGALVAGSAALAGGALSFIQFLNPSANWYALFLCVVALAVAWRTPEDSRTGLAMLGFLIGVCFFTRQLSGVILAIGMLTWLMLQRPGRSENAGNAGRFFVAFLAIGIAAYVLSKWSLTAVVLFGVWPLWLLSIAFLQSRLDARELGSMLGWLLAGALAAAMPPLVYHAMNGALLAWLHDIFLVALQIHVQDFIAQADFIELLVSAATSLFSANSLGAAISSLGWVMLVLLVPLTGFLCVRHVQLARHATGLHPLPVVAPFWALIAVHYQIPIYLFFTLPVVVAAMLYVRPERLTIVAVVALSAWAIVFHAGQPLSRGYLGTIEGQRGPGYTPADLPGVSLRITPQDQADFRAIVSRIEAGARPGEALMTLPMEPELNFMTGRRSPVRYYGTPLGLTNDADLADTLRRLKASAPLFVVHRRDDKYLTPLTARLLGEVQKLSPAPQSIGPFDLYRLPAASPGDSHPAPDRE